MQAGTWILVGLIAALVLYAIVEYNRLVQLRNRFKNAFAQIDVQLKRRYDLIPNLVESVKGYLAHERGTLEAVVKARGEAVSAEQRAAAAPGDPAAMRGLAQAEGALGGALGRLLAVFEAYPDLKANANVLALQEELASTENKVAFARQAYNDSVMAYNTRRESFPDNLLAGPLRFAPAELLRATESAEERRAPKVSFG
ncbi:MAG TPA: LemA family protein [Burkholderiales bacterium]|jgi:LemA protein|nr:LemA family protein [Burkholderiales bacterium]